MSALIARYDEPKNEPVLEYRPGSPERATLKAALVEQSQNPVEVPLYIGTKRVYRSGTQPIHCPHRHSLQLGNAHQGGKEEAVAAIEAAKRAAPEWAGLPWEQRAAVFLRAAELLAGPWRARINAATMLGQSKTCHQSEIDAACEMADFFRFNVHYLRNLLANDQPLSASPIWNQVELRPLEGFVFAVTPFNFTSIAANLASAPALLGNTVVWKPAPSSMLSAYHVMELFLAAGLPPGVINFIAGPAPEIAEVVLHHPDLAGVHFTGSTAVFRSMWQTVGQNIERYRTYPRLVGETGGKDFILAHESACEPGAEEDALIAAILRGGYEYQGQKCSAASRIYLPETQGRRLLPRLIAEVEALRMGNVADFRNFLGAVIDKRAFDRISGAIEATRSAPGAKIVAGGQCDSREGYFIRPTLVVAEEPKHRLMCEELFGPVVTVHFYRDYNEALQLVESTSPYALTGAIFARDRRVIAESTRVLRNAAGNLYINDKPTGAVVGQQPFGGARASGTNDKAGSPHNLLRWTSMRTIKENFVPPTDYRYGFMAEE